MNELIDMRFFSLLAEPSQEVTNEEMQTAYGCFMKRVETLIQSEKDYSKVYRTLHITRIELASIESHYRYEQGKKCPETCLFTKSTVVNNLGTGTIKTQNSLP